MLHIFDIPSIIATYGYIGIFIIVLLESGVFFFLPGDSLLFTAGILASIGMLQVYHLVPIIFVGTFLGGVAGYFIGFNIERARKLPILNRVLKEDYIIETHKFFEKHGQSAIIFSRFIPIVRTFTPIVAGFGRMNYRHFLKYNLIGALVWSFIVTLLGYFLGRSFPEIKNYMSHVILLVILVSIIPGVWKFFQEKRKNSLN